MEKVFLIDYEVEAVSGAMWDSYLVTHAAMQFNNNHLIHNAVIESRCFSSGCCIFVCIHIAVETFIC